MSELTHQYVNTAVLELFPRNAPNGDTIYDERCACGHLRSNHHDRFAVGHGKCGQVPCGCSQFTWAEWIKGESDIEMSRR
jgi:hypothetical protein